MICPKCNYILSDKSLVCVYCGCVVNYEHKDSKSLHNMFIKRINEGNNLFLAQKSLRNYRIPKNECYNLLNMIGNTVLKGIYKGNIAYLYDEFLRCGYEMEFIPSKDEYVNPANSEIEERLRERGERIANNEKNMKCPRCTSSNLQIDRISPLFSGGYRWKQRCRNCGYIWKVE